MATDSQVKAQYPQKKKPDAKMPAAPQVSIGMPVYNGTPFIRDALNSLLAQTFTDFELIISDNASTDGTEAICREYAAKDARIRYVRQAENRGATANFQFVLDQAEGEYFIWAAADDLNLPSLLTDLIPVMSSDPSIVCVASDFENIDEAGNNLFLTSLDTIRREEVANDWNRVRGLFFRNPTSNIFFCIYGLFRREAIRQVELNYKNKVLFATASEVPILAQLSLIGKIVSIPQVLRVYRRHSESYFHKEQATFDTYKAVSRMNNISALLFQIAANANHGLGVKIGLFSQISRSYVRWLTAFLVRLPVRLFFKRN